MTPTSPAQVPTATIRRGPNAVQRANRRIAASVVAFFRAFCRWWSQPIDTDPDSPPRAFIFCPFFGQILLLVWILLLSFNAIMWVCRQLGRIPLRRFLFGPDY